MKIKVIHTEQEYDTALKRAYQLMQIQELSDEELDEFELLTLIIQKYEDEKYPIPTPNPIEAIKFRLEQLGISENELSKILGSRQRKHEILSGKRKLNLKMVRQISKKLNIDPAILVKEY